MVWGCVVDQRTQSTYLFGAVCPERGTGAALVLPACNSEAMQLHLDEIATKVTPGAHAIVLLDQAGWHGGKVLKVPSNISLMPLPPPAPELNGQENIWQFMRQNWLSNRVFKSLTISSITAATPGTRSSISPGRSCPSRAAIGLPWVTQCEDGYNPGWTASGRAAIQESLGKEFAADIFKYTSIIVDQSQRVGDLNYSQGTYTADMKGPDGKNLPVNGIENSLFEGNGYEAADVPADATVRVALARS